MNRSDAIEALALADLGGLSKSARELLLLEVLHEDWTLDPAWQSLPAALRKELEGDALRFSASDSRYDAALKMSLRFTYSAASNEYLAHRTTALDVDFGQIDGQPEAREPCPCCGARTLETRSDYEICQVCWWEDDGHDNDSADSNSGPNHLSLTQARANFLVTGIFDPLRNDLRARQEPSSKYVSGRKFRLSEAESAVVEDACGWESRAFCSPES